LHSALNPTRPDPGANVVRYELDARMSRFRVQVFAGGLLSAFGHNPVIAIRDFAGEISYNPQAVEQGTVTVRIDPRSFEVASEVSDKDRREIEETMRRNVLEVERYPEILYECSRLSASKTGEGQYWIALNGDLTLHGVTRGQAVSSRVSVSGNMLRASSEFTVRQSDYEIKPVSVAGILKVKDELKLSFDIVARSS